MNRKLPTLALLALLFMVQSASAQTRNWTFVDEASAVKLNTEKFVQPQLYKTLSLDFNSFKTFLNTAPKEILGSKNEGMIIELPYPDNTFKRFSIVETELMEAGLAVKLPGIKTFVGKGIDDPYATVRIDYTYQGFHAFIMTPNGNVFIDPYERTNTGLYMSYFSKDYLNTAKEVFNCGVKDAQRTEATLATNNCVGTQLKTYRLALACTGEYAVAVCAPSAATVPLTASAIVTSVNRVTGVYETELSIRFKLVADNNSLIYLDGTTDPYTNDDGETMLAENQATITSIIGTANFDIGHVFSTGGGGIADLGAVCQANFKAEGVTGSSNPVGDNYDIDYVAHEMGHQFGGNHTFNSVTGSCGGGNRNASTAYEVGSGTTIMAYAGICGTDDTQPHSDPHFHTASFDEIITYTTTGAGAGCAVVSATGNNFPVVTMPANNVMIPKSTPFVLTGSATDVNGDALTYDWEEWDLGTSGAWNSGAASTNRPLFKSRIPTTSPTRYFPALPVILAGYPTTPSATMGGLKGETLPTVARNIKFRLTVRDNKPGGGGVATGGNGCSSTGTFTVVVTADGPFVMTAPNTNVVWAGNSTQTVTWNVANTNSAAGINCQNVDILLSTDGGLTYPTTILANTPNDGSQAITVPNISTTAARIMVKANGNIFFDISDVNFTIASVLPVALLDFKVTSLKDNLQLNWATAQEINNKGFEILRSEGSANNFTRTGFVAGAGTSSSLNKYIFSDRNIRKGVDYFYRLRQIDKDNNPTLSEVRQGRINEDGLFNMIISPNPVASAASIYFNGLSKENFRIIMTDAAGKTISTNVYKNNAGSNNVSINLEQLAKGIYFVKFIQNNNVVTQKIIKQ